jgi:hypothetical protein
METVEFRHVEVIDEALTGLLCRIGAQRVTIPSLLLQPGTTIRHRGDDGTLVIPRWLGIGVGLVWPFPEPAVGHPPANELPKRRGPRRAPYRQPAAGRVASGGGA